MKHILVTGGAGFIGSHLVETLLHQGHRVRVLDNLSTSTIDRIEPFLKDIEFMLGDIRNEQMVIDAVHGIDIILHQGAIPSVQRSMEDPKSSTDVNVMGTFHLLSAARHANIERFVFASSSSVYGNNPTLPKVETMPYETLSPYAASKLAGESYTQTFMHAYGLPTIALRYFNVFGPRQDPTSEYSAVIPRFITAMIHGKAPTIYGTGEQSRDFTYIENVVHANLLAAFAPSTRSGVFNVASGGRTSLLELAQHINDYLGTTIAPEHHPARIGDVLHSQASIQRITETLGYRLVVSFAEGLERTIKSFR